MPEKDKGKEFKDQFVIDMMNLLPGIPEPVMPTPRKFGDERSMFERDLAPFGEQAEQRLNSVKEAERMNTISPLGDFAEQRMNTVKDAEEDRFKKMQMLNGNTFENGERSQGDQEAEQRMVQNKKTGLLQKFVDKIKEGFSEVKAGLGENPFNKALEKEFGTEDQPKFGGKDGVMYNGQFVHPDFYKLIMNRPDLKERFDRTGSIYGE